MPADQTHTTKFLLSIIGLVLIVPLLAFSVIQLEGPRIRADVQADLAAIARLKAGQIESWLGERRNHAQTLMTSDSFVGAVENWFVSHSPEAAAHIDSRLAAIRRAYGYEAELIDPRNLDAEGSDPSSGLSRAERRTLLNRALASGEAQISELYRDPQGQVWLEQIIPLSRGPRAAGAVALRMPAGAFLFPFIQTWPTPSPSGETLLIRRDGDQVLFLNELRHRQDTALNLRLPLDSPELPSAIALRRGGAQFIEGRDYRGVETLMSSQPVAGTAWLVAAKIDRKEVLSPLYKLVGWVSLVALIGIVALGLVLMRLRRQEQRGHQQELQVSSNERDRLLSLFYELPFMGMAIVEPTDCKFLQVNDRLCEILGYRRKELLGQSWVRFVPAEQGEACAHEHQRLLKGEIDSYQLEQRLLRKDGASIATALAARCVRRADGSVEYVVKTVRDISERKHAEQELQHLNRTLQAYSSSGWSLVHARDEASYLRDFCRILVEDCGHALVWIGQAEQDEACTIRPLAQAGFDDGYLDQLDLSWGDNPRGRGPSGTAVRDGQPVICHHIDSDLAFRPWRDEALRRGYASSIALPVGLDGERVLVINIYSRQPEAFSEEEVHLLQKMADEMAYGLGVLHLRAERRQQQEDLQASEQRFRLLATATQEGIAISELGYLVDINQRLLDMFGYSREEVLDQPMTELLKMVAADLLSAEESARIQDNFRAGNESRFECPMRRKDGQLITVEVHGQTHVGDGRTFRITVLRDITERKWAEDLLRRSQTQLYSFVEQAPLSIAMLNRQMHYLAYSRRWLKEYGAGHTDLIGRDHYQVHPSDEYWRAIHQRGLAGETLRKDEDRWPQEDGSELWLRWAVVPWRDEYDEIGGIIISAEDITERKHIELELADSRARLAGIIDSAMDAIITLDAQQRVRLFNPAAERMFGYRAEDMLGQSIEQLIPARLRQRHQQQMQSFSATGQASMNIARPRELYALGHDGKEFPIEISISRANIGGEQIFTAILRDISERVAGEQVLHEREVDLNRAQAVGHLGSWRLDVRRNELSWSEENHRIFEVPLGTTMTYEFFLSRVHPDDRAYVDLEWQAALRGEPYDIEHRLLVNGRVKWVREKATLEFAENGDLIGGFGITQDISDIKQAEQALRESEERFQLAAEIGHSGTWDWDLVNDAVIWSRGHFEILGYRQGEVDPGYQAWIERVHPDDRQRLETELQHCMQQHRDYAAEFRVIWPDASVHWMSAHGRFEYAANPSTDSGADSSSCTRMLGVMADISTQKLAELALREADQRKDEFLAMLAHELRNPLAPIRNAAHVLGRLELDEPRVRWAQNIIERQVSHLTHLVDELLDVSRIALGKITLKQVRVELADLVRQACEAVQPLMSAKQHRFEVRLPSQTVPLMGDPVRLLQILQNLLHNAAKYTPDSGHIELVAQCHGQQLELRVRDNGMGMPADLLPGVFDLFRQGERTLDRAQGGLGIGLTLVRRLVELHGGQVEALSPGPGQGSTFCVYLPIANGLAQADPTDHTPAPTATPRLRVLVVDDDAMVAESMVVFLELEGHQVRSADSGHNALLLLESFRPQVVLLDIGLPGQDGYEIARLIRTQPGGEGMTLVAVSGYGHDEAVKRSLQSGFARHLIKPVDPEVLSALLAEISA